MCYCQLLFVDACSSLLLRALLLSLILRGTIHATATEADSAVTGVIRRAPA